MNSSKYSIDDDEQQEWPRQSFLDTYELPSNPLSVNRWRAHYHPHHFLSEEILESPELVKSIEEIPPKLQRRIRFQINEELSPNKQISYAHIKPGSPEYKKKYAKMIIDRYNQLTYLKKITEQEEHTALDPEVYSQVSTYRPKELDTQFKKIPFSVKKEIMHFLGLKHENITHYNKENKRKILTVFRSQYME